METLEIIRDKAARTSALGKKLNINLGDKVIHIDGTGEVNLVSQENSTADCTLHISEENLQQLLNGALDAMSAMMSGKMSIEGDMGVAMKL